MTNERDHEWARTKLRWLFARIARNLETAAARLRGRS